MTETSTKVHLIVVTYNPDLSLLILNLSRIMSQFSSIIVVDNSDNNSDIISLFSSKLPSVRLVLNGQNLGIAMAQNIGISLTSNSKDDFIFLLDQDSSINEGFIAEQVKVFQQQEELGVKMGALGPGIRPADYKMGKNCPGGKKLKKVREMQSSGLLTRKEVYEQIGGLRENLFIDLVDYEWCWRLKRAGFVCLINPNIILSHRLGVRVFSLFGLEWSAPSPIRHYYQFRNSLLMICSRLPGLNWKLKSVLTLTLKFVFYPLILSDGVDRLRFMILGVKDFVRGKKGKIA